MTIKEQKSLLICMRTFLGTVKWLVLRLVLMLFGRMV